MDLDVTRRIARLQYAPVRLPFTLLYESVVAPYWDRDALVRAGFERWLGSLDLLPGNRSRARPGLVAPGPAKGRANSTGT